MANKFLQGLAITFGGGLAFGAGLKLGQNTLRGKDSPQFSALTGRLDSIENRIQRVELAPPPVSFDGPRPEGFDPQVLDRSLGALEAKLAQRIESMSGEIRQVESRVGSELEAGSARQTGQTNALNRRLDEIQTRLRSEMEAGDRRAQQQIDGFSGQIKRLEADLPGHIEAAITPRIQALNERFEKDLAASQARTLDALVETIETKVVRRMTDLETSLAGQSEVIGGLRDKSLRSDQNMQTLLRAVEKLCDQTERQIARRDEIPAEKAGHGAGPPPAEDHAPALLVVESPLEPEVRVEPEPVLPTPANGAPALMLVEAPEPEVVSFLPPPEPEPSPAPFLETPVAPVDIPAVATVEAPFEAADAPLIEEAEIAVEPAKPEPSDTELEPALVGQAVACPDGTTIPVPAIRRQETKPAAEPEADDAAALDLFTPPPTKRREWRLPLAFSLLTVAGGLSALQMIGVFDSAHGSSRPHASASLQAPLKTDTQAADGVSEAEMENLLNRLAANPNDQATLLHMGRAYSQKKEWGRAEQVFRSALAVNGLSKDAVLGLSDALYQQQKFDESSAVLAKLGSKQ